MKFTFKEFLITAGGTPQPLVGTLSTGAVKPTGGAQSIVVSDSSMFDNGDSVYIDTLGNAEKVDQITVVDATHISGIFQKAHAINVAVALYLPISSLYVQPAPENLGTVIIFYNQAQFSPVRADGFGRKSQVMAIVNFVFGVTQLLKPGAATTQPNDFSDANNYGADSDNLCYWWVDGTTGDEYLPSVVVT